MNTLIQKSEYSVEKIKEWKRFEYDRLLQSASDETWSVLQCVEHLNLYSAHYIPQIESYHRTDQKKRTQIYQPGWLWNRFARTMLIDSSKISIKTFADKEPRAEGLSKAVLDDFLAYQERLLYILRLDERLDLHKRHVTLSLSPFFKMQLGDALCLQVYHNERHIKQAEKILDA